MIGIVRSRAANIVHKRRFGRADVVDDQICYRGTVYEPLLHITV